MRLRNWTYSGGAKLTQSTSHATGAMSRIIGGLKGWRFSE
jgi:hypothetical protein